MSNPEIQQSDQPYRELTFSALILGVIQGIVLNIAFVYAALQQKCEWKVDQALNFLYSH